KTIFAAINKSYQSSADGEVLQACTPELRTAAINKGAACPIPGKGRGGRFVEHNNGNQIVLQ
ncbi:MAG: hypothetical protein LUD81_05450, partial [Clostridiales bacterium]|nr:hypothetical protein [Clostridiales bacterium]